MGHSKIPQSPCHGRQYGYNTIRGRCVVSHVVDMGHAKVSCQGTGVVSHGIPAACNLDAKEYNDNQRNAHDNTLNQVRGGHCHKPSHDCVSDDDHSACDHCHMVIYAEQAVEQGSHRLKARRGIGNKENQDNDGGNAHQYVPVIPVAAGEKVGYGDGPACNGITAQAPGNNQPVEICTHGQTNGGPARIRDAGQVCNSRQAHEKPAAHIRSLGAHGSYQCAQFAASQIEFVGRITAALFAEIKTYIYHGRQIHGDGCQDSYLSSTHFTLLLCVPLRKTDIMLTL